MRNKKRIEVLEERTDEISKRLGMLTEHFVKLSQKFDEFSERAQEMGEVIKGLHEQVQPNADFSTVFQMVDDIKGRLGGNSDGEE